MGDLSSLVDRQDRPAYVRFERRPVEDKAASVANGRYTARDVDYALISPPYSKDVIVQKVSAWLAQLDQDVKNDRLPPQWRDAYKEGYARWQNGQEMPLNGTPIKGWGVISPAQQENLIRMNILTVEDLAGVNDEGAKRIGHGWLDLKNKAVAWLRQIDDKGPLTIEVAALKQENANLKTQVEALTNQFNALAQKREIELNMTVAPPQTTITADDILPERETLTLKKR